VPDTGLAGDWKLWAALDGSEFFTTFVRAQCRATYYEVPSSWRCESCPIGSSCLTSGTTLATLPIKPGYWRTGELNLTVLWLMY
jgi:hypothetical protein